MTRLIRIKAARAALARVAWARRQTPAYDEDAIIDLLADIRQWCAAAGLDFSRCNHIAWIVCRTASKEPSWWHIANWLLLEAE